MAFLHLNGVELPVRANSASFEDIEIGSETRAFSGFLRKSRQAVKAKLKVETPPLLASDAEAWLNFVRGVGWVWRFDSGDLYSWNGRGPTAHTGTVGVSTVQARFGSHSMALGASSTVTFGLPIGDIWTLSFWVWGGTSWGHWLARSDGARWINGTRNDAAPLSTYATVTDTSLRLQTNTYFDDLVVLPYLVPAAWAPTFAAATGGFSPLPNLLCIGDVLGRSTYMRGTVKEVKYSNGVMAGAWRTDLQALVIELDEV